MSHKTVFALVLTLSLAVSLGVLMMPASPASAANPASLDPGFTNQYTVAPGDTLSAIAKKFNTTADLLSMANAIADPNYIRAGQVLMVPDANMASDPDVSLDILDQQQMASHAVAFDYQADRIPTDSDDTAALSATAPAASPATAPITPGVSD